jgi:hypothetical protein
LIDMIEGRVQADGTPQLQPLAARTKVMRKLLEVSIGVASMSTLAGGVLAVGQVGTAAPGAASAATTSTDVSLLAAQATPAARADLDSLTLRDLEPVGAVVQDVVDTVEAADLGPLAPLTTLVRVEVATPPPAQPTPTTAPPPAATTPLAGSADEVRAIILEVFGPVNGPAAIRVANCESHLNPRAVSRGGGNWGLFQINRVHRPWVESLGYQWEDVLDARVNTLLAKRMFDASGWRPWACKP